MPQETEGVRFILMTNKLNLIDFIRDFQTTREEPEFIALKNRMREVLDDMWICKLYRNIINLYIKNFTNDSHFMRTY